MDSFLSDRSDNIVENNKSKRGLIEDKIREKNLFCSYYTKCDYITNYMVNRLNLKNNNYIFEPSAGDGVFIDKILDEKVKSKIIAYDLDKTAINKLRNKYGENSNVDIFNSDTLLDGQLDNERFDRIIGNPPYGAWQDYDKREVLKNKYPGHYVKETYSLFLLRCVSLLKEEVILTFIIPDTFMNLHRHSKLREYLLLNSKIKEILMIPSKFFPKVNFGYSNLAIITLEKTSTKKVALDNEIRIIKDLKEVSNIKDIEKNDNLEKYNINHISQEKVYNSLDSAFLINGGQEFRELINNSSVKLKDLAHCVTGIYTGNNKEYLRVGSSSVRNYSKSPIIDKAKINKDYLEYKNILKGIDSNRCFIPIVKGSPDNKYIRNYSKWYIDWGVEAIKHYNENKKARFQNAQFYFQRGIAVPMVKSSRIKATLINRQVFDQSIVGIFPKNDKYLLFLLALFNSEIGKKIIQTINPTTNSSANYLKKIPIVLPDDSDLKYINRLVRSMINIMSKTKKIDEEIQNKINNYFNSIYFS